MSIQKTRSIALKAFPGKIVDEELEHEKGGSGLRYSFDIRKGKTTQEVGVDANTGKVLENNPESAHAD
ncbi:MAG: PepSY domain-containing protein [Burkholderiales bacterium]|nr:PepSY domain-containing protein [Burkholderiales bacterium]